MTKRIGIDPVDGEIPAANGTRVLYDNGGRDANFSTTGRLDVVLAADQPLTVTRLWAKSVSDGLHVVQTWSYPVSGTVGAKRTYTLTCVAKASLANNDYFTVTFVVLGVVVVVVFEYQVDGDFEATGGRIAIDVREATDAQSVAVLTRAAINANVLQVLCGVPVAGVATVTAAHMGTANSFSMSENVANAGFTVVAGTAAVDAEVLALSLKKFPGRDVLTVTAGATPPTDYVVAMEEVDERAVAQ